MAQPTPDLAYAATLSPEAAIRYFEAKGWRIGWDWHDTLDEAHARAFTLETAIGDRFSASPQRGMALGGSETHGGSMR